MSAINWGVVFGVCSLLLLQVSFAIGAAFLFFALKSQVERTKDIIGDHLRETDRITSEAQRLGKKVDGYDKKLEEFKSVKIDGWEEADKMLLSKIKSNGSRISQLHRLLKEGDQEEDPSLDFNQAGPVPTPINNMEHPAGGLSPDFGRSV